MMAAAETSPSLYRLGALLEGIAAVEPAAAGLEIHGLALDSRRVQPGDLFVALKGRIHCGLDYLDQALGAGAAAVAYERDEHEQPVASEYPVPVIGIPRLSEKVGLIAERFFGYPSRDLFVIGVTGTNGKTSCTHFLAQVLDREAQHCGVIGTLGWGTPGALSSIGHTTPDPVTLHGVLARLRDQGVRRVAMEVSSHGLQQGRVNDVSFDLALWTNLTHEHLDYHGDMNAYAAAKGRLFQVPGLRYAVVNLDDAYGRRLLETMPSHVEVVGYGLDADKARSIGARAGCRYVLGRDLALSDAGFTLRVDSSWGEAPLQTGLLGRFNVSNVLAVLAALLTMDVPLTEAVERSARIQTVPGRMERFGGGPDRPTVVVDYAHTPDALEQALTALREHCRGDLWCVFGCGGERDRTKRPVMGAVAERVADHVVITDDNPRREDATQIVVDIMAGMNDPDGAYVRRDRGAAIAFALDQARAGDVVLVAGKGHEDYQLLGECRLPFSDREHVARHMEKRS